jgi:hypothetical protein
MGNFIVYNRKRKMNILHMTFESMFGTMFVVAWFDDNKKIYEIQWHGIDDDGIIGKKLDYSFDDLKPIISQAEEALQRYNA